MLADDLRQINQLALNRIEQRDILTGRFYPFGERNNPDGPPISQEFAEVDTHTASSRGVPGGQTAGHTPLSYRRQFPVVKARGVSRQRGRPPGPLAQHGFAPLDGGQDARDLPLQALQHRHRVHIGAAAGLVRFANRLFPDLLQLLFAKRRLGIWTHAELSVRPFVALLKRTP